MEVRRRVEMLRVRLSAQRGRLERLVDGHHRRPLVDDAERGFPGHELVERRLEAGEAVEVLAVERRHEVLSEAVVEVEHERVRRAVVAEDLAVSLVTPERERVLRATVPRVRVRRRLHAEPAEEALDVRVEMLIRDRSLGAAVPRQLDREV